MNIISGNQFGKAVCEALGLEYNRVRRIVIDAALDNLVLVYVEYIGDERLLSVAPVLAGLEIKIVDTQKAEPE